MKPFSFFVIAIAFAGASCEKHDFEETRKLHEHHAADEHASGHDANGSQEHGDHKTQEH